MEHVEELVTITFCSIAMTPLLVAEGNAFGAHELENYNSDDYSEWTEASVPADANRVGSEMWYDAFPDVLNEEYMSTAAPHSAPALEADHDAMIEETTALGSVESGATFESEIPVENEEDAISEWSDAEYESSETWTDEETWTEEDEDEDLNEPSEYSDDTLDTEDDEDVTTDIEECDEVAHEPVDDETLVSLLALIADYVAAEVHLIAVEEAAAWIAIRDAALAVTLIDPYFAQALYPLVAEDIGVPPEAVSLIDNSAELSDYYPVVGDAWTAGSPAMTFTQESSAEAEAHYTPIVEEETWTAGLPWFSETPDSAAAEANHTTIVEEETWTAGLPWFSLTPDSAAAETPVVVEEAWTPGSPWSTLIPDSGAAMIDQDSAQAFFSLLAEEAWAGAWVAGEAAATIDDSA